MSGTESSKAFYVYELIDPRDGMVFYVGKGKANRYLHHLSEANSGKRSAKCDRIRSIISECGQYDWRIVARFSDEQMAYDAEADLILSYGLENLDNILPGGGRALEAYNRRSIDPARQAYQYLVSHKATIKKIIALSEAGVSVKYRELDFVRTGLDVVSRWRDAVGEDKFSQFLRAA